jgi:hypothetical protein
MTVVLELHPRELALKWITTRLTIFCASAKEHDLAKTTNTITCNTAK